MIVSGLVFFPKRLEICRRISLQKLNDGSLLPGAQMIAVFGQDSPQTLHDISGVLTDLPQIPNSIRPVRPFQDRVEQKDQILLERD